MNILQIPTLSDTEQDQILAIFTTPLVQKYLRCMGLSIVQDITSGFPNAGQSDSEYIRQEAHYKGRLAVLETLLSIQPRV